MAMNINTNIASLNAQRNLGKSQGMLNKSLQRLSSGLRINSAKDDAAGLAISNRMTSQIRGLDQAVRNANDGISLAQTAEGALQESGNILQRIRELAVQSSSDGSTDTDRASMQVEVGQLVAELDRIADTTSFNGQVLLDGSFGTGKFQVGANAGETVSMSMTSAKTNALGATGGVATGAYSLAKEKSTAGSLVTSGSMTTLGAGALSLNGTEIRASISGDDTVSSTDNGGSSIAIAAAINASSNKTGVYASAEQTTTTLTMVGGDDSTTAAGDLKINGVNIGAFVADANLDTAGGNVADAINAAGAGVTATYSVADDELTLTSVDGRNIQIETDTAAVATVMGTDFSAGDNKVVRGQVSLYSNEAFTIEGTEPGVVGFSAQSVAANEEKLLETTSGTTSVTLNISATTGTTGSASGAGDFTINGTDISFTTLDAQSAIANAAVLQAAIGTNVEGVTAVDNGDGSITLTSTTGSINLGTDGSLADTTLGITTSTGFDSESGDSATYNESHYNSGANTFDNLSNGDLTINGYNVDFAVQASAITNANEQSLVDAQSSAMFMAAAINATAGLKDEVTASATTVANLGKVSEATIDDNFGLTINGLSIDIDNDVMDSDADGSLVGTLNTAFAAAADNSDAEGLVASINDKGELLITADDGRNINVAVDVGGKDDSGTTTLDRVANAASFLGNFDATSDTNVTAKGTIALEAKSGEAISSITGGKQALAGIETAVGTIENVDISTYEGAQNAIKAIDGALAQIDNQRAELGAIQNRFDSTISNLSTTSENLSAAKARIMDADFASETANMTKAQILQQAGTAMLAQANQLPQAVLSLLG